MFRLTTIFVLEPTDLTYTKIQKPAFLHITYSHIAGNCLKNFSLLFTTSAVQNNLNYHRYGPQKQRKLQIRTAVYRKQIITIALV